MIEILGEEVYNNQNNNKRRGDEALVDRVNHINGVRDNVNSFIK